MLMTPEVLQQHWEYNIWATNRLMASTRELSPDELNRDFKSADRSVLETIVHLFWAERIWLNRFKSAPALSRPAPGNHSFDYVESEWPALQDEWREYLDKVDDAAAVIMYRDLKGQEWTQPLWQLLFHIVNHGTHHRGQVSGFLRAMNYTPPPLDFVLFHRLRAS
jgi:uncharacterized damage-inducible protein DinB